MAEILYDAPVAPDTLTYYMRALDPGPDLTLSNLVPTRFLNGSTVRWGDITRRNRQASYRPFDGQIPVARRDTATDQAVRLAPFSNSLNLGEYERLQQEYLRMGGSQAGTLVDAIYNDADALVRSMHCRVEAALGTVITTGKFTINENNFQAEADFNVDGLNKVGATAKWDISGSTAAADLRAYGSRYLTSAGVRAGQIITTEAVVNALMTSPDIVGEVVGTTSGRTWINRAELSTWLTMNRLPADIVEVETTVYNEDAGTDSRIIPEGTLILAPSTLAGTLEFVYGLSATALELVQSNRAELSFADAPGIVGLVVKDGPPFRQFTYVDAVGMPVLSSPKQLLIASALLTP